MNKVFVGVLAVLSGLLFCCPKVEACEDDIFPCAGFEETIKEIEVKPEKILPRYILTDEDADLLLRVGVCEAGETDRDGIANVMQVVLNRVFESDDFPNSVRGVIFQDKQFSTAHMLATANVTPEAYAALDCVIFGEYKSNEALYFESLPGVVWDNVHDYQFSYGGHDFYK